MDVKEKLAELLVEFIEVDAWDNGEFIEKNIDFQKIASDLTAHGVTVQERGQWIYDFNLAGSNFYHCSVCNRQETLLEKEDIYEYCPFCHCGAKMIPKLPKGE